VQNQYENSFFGLKLEASATHSFSEGCASLCESLFDHQQNDATLNLNQAAAAAFGMRKSNF